MNKVTTVFESQLTVSTYGGFAPVCYKNPSGQLIGLDVSFLTRFAESLGLAIVTREEDFDGIWKSPGENRCDVAGAGIMKREDRPTGDGGTWSDDYFEVQRSLLVRTADRAAFDDYETLRGKTIVVTRGSTADIDAQSRYRECKIVFVDKVAEGQADAQDYIVRELIGKHRADAFGEGNVSNQYLKDKYGREVEGGLELADVHPIGGMTEPFNFVVRNASTGILEKLNAFIAKNKGCYAPRS